MSKHRRWYMVLLLLFAAIGLFISTRLTWSVAERVDGARYGISPIGIVFVMIPEMSSSPYMWADWTTGWGDKELLQMADEGKAEYAELKLVYPLLLIALGILVVMTIVTLLAKDASRVRFPLVGMSWVAVFLIYSAIWMFSRSANEALHALTPYNVVLGGTIGYLLITTTALLIVAATICLMPKLFWLPITIVLSLNLFFWYPVLWILVPMGAILAYMGREVQRSPDEKEIAEVKESVSVPAAT